MHSNARIIRDSLQKQETGRLPCFPLIDIAFASSYSSRPMREVQLDPHLHAGVLSKCAEELPVDGVYINLCIDTGQGVRISDRETVIDGSLHLVIPENDVLSISSTEITSLDDGRIVKAELFHPGMLATFNNIDDNIKENHKHK